MKELVVIGFLGSVLDSGEGEERWEKWRPSVSLARQQELPNIEDRTDMRSKIPRSGPNLRPGYSLLISKYRGENCRIGIQRCLGSRRSLRRPL